MNLSSRSLIKNYWRCRAVIRWAGCNRLWCNYMTFWPRLLSFCFRMLLQPFLLYLCASVSFNKCRRNWLSGMRAYSAAAPTAVQWRHAACIKTMSCMTLHQVVSLMNAGQGHAAYRSVRPSVCLYVCLSVADNRKPLALNGVTSYWPGERVTWPLLTNCCSALIAIVCTHLHHHRHHRHQQQQRRRRRH